MPAGRAEKVTPAIVRKLIKILGELPSSETDAFTIDRVGDFGQSVSEKHYAVHEDTLRQLEGDGKLPDGLSVDDLKAARVVREDGYVDFAQLLELDTMQR